MKEKKTVEITEETKGERHYGGRHKEIFVVILRIRERGSTNSKKEGKRGRVKHTKTKTWRGREKA